MIVDGKFFAGIALGMIAGALLLDNSNDVKKLVGKGKKAVKSKMDEMNQGKSQQKNS